VPEERSAVYQEIHHFYARQMRLLDEGRVAEWAETFEPEGVFDANGHPEPLRGREMIESGARKASERLAADGVQRRHWLGMLEVAERPDGTLFAQTYALILSTPRGGQATVHMSTTCADVLVRDEGTLRVRRRTVRRDDLAAADGGEN
jgi:3-phenylpropionate/cinnamic acid dioxygenase small subunit